MGWERRVHRARRRDVRTRQTHNFHHIIPISRAGGNDDGNVVYIDRRLHAVWHAVFSNMTPREAFLYASSDFYGVSLRIIRALVKQLGTGIVTDVLRDVSKNP